MKNLKYYLFAVGCVLIVVLAIVLTSCVPVAENGSGTPQPGFFDTRADSANIKQVANTTDVIVYKFQDGTRVCYFTENDYSNDAGSGIWCTP
jgi:hypothetical protein